MVIETKNEIACQSSLRWYKQLLSNVSGHNWSYQTIYTQTRHEFNINCFIKERKQG